MEFFKPGRVFDFMGVRWFWVPFSLLAVAVSTVLCFYPGPNYGTDFKGGTEVEIAFSKPLDAGSVRSAVESVGFKSPDIVQIVDTNRPNHFLIRVQDVSAITEDEKSALRTALCYVRRIAGRRPSLDPVLVTPDDAARNLEVKFSAVAALTRSPPATTSIPTSRRSRPRSRACRACLSARARPIRRF